MAAEARKTISSAEVVDLTGCVTGRGDGQQPRSSAFISRLGANSTEDSIDLDILAPTKRQKMTPFETAATSGRRNNNDAFTEVVERPAEVTEINPSNSDANKPECAEEMSPAGTWSCTACTFLNEKLHGLVCSICGTARRQKRVTV